MECGTPHLIEFILGKLFTDARRNKCWKVKERLNFRHTNNIILVAASEEDLRNLLLKVKESSALKKTQPPTNLPIACTNPMQTAEKARQSNNTHYLPGLKNLQGW